MSIVDVSPDALAATAFALHITCPPPEGSARVFALAGPDPVGGSPGSLLRWRALGWGWHPERLLAAIPSPPEPIAGIAMQNRGWAAPDDGRRRGAPLPASRHPARQRVHVTSVVGGADRRLVSVVTIGDGAPEVLPDGVGILADALHAAWARISGPAA